jgi:hypothetical protein
LVQLPGGFDTKNIHLLEQEKVDILVFTDIGMDASEGTTKWAFARMAPVQVQFWGHPITSALPNMDYFVTSDAFEPGGPEPQSRFSEQLVRFSSLGFFFREPELDESSKSPSPAFKASVRSKYSIPAAAPVYLVPQTMYKLHPSFDYPIAQLLARDKSAVVVITGVLGKGTDISDVEAAYSQDRPFRRKKGHYHPVSPAAAAAAAASLALAPGVLANEESGAKGWLATAYNRMAKAVEEAGGGRDRLLFLPYMPVSDFWDIVAASEVPVLLRVALQRVALQHGVCVCGCAADGRTRCAYSGQSSAGVRSAGVRPRACGWYCSTDWHSAVALTLPPWRVQVLLDPYPFGGGVTSLEAFAMCKAVSVLTLTCGAQAMLIPSH